MKNLPNRPIICIDMKCFYASCMALLHNLDVEQTPIAVIGSFQQRGSVVLATSPAMKKISTFVQEIGYLKFQMTPPFAYLNQK